MTNSSEHMQQFVSLLTNHQELIRSYIISLVPGSPDVLDIRQEVNILLWEKKDDFEVGSNFGAWACTTAYYKVLDHRKKQKRDGILVFSDKLTEALAGESESRTPDLIESKRRALDYCLAKLKGRERKLLDARYSSKGGDMELLSSDTGRSRASLRISLHRLRGSLRQCISQQLTTERGEA